MNMQIFVVVIYRNPLGDLGRKCARVFIAIAPRRVEEPQCAAHQRGHDDPESQPAFASNLRVPPESHLKGEALRFDHLSVVDQDSFSLHSGVGAESVPGVQLKFYEVSKKGAAVFLFRHAPRLGRPKPFDLRARWIDQGGLQPVRNDLLVVRRKSAVKLWIRTEVETSNLRRKPAHDAEPQSNEEHDGFHFGPRLAAAPKMSSAR